MKTKLETANTIGIIGLIFTSILIGVFIWQTINLINQTSILSNQTSILSEQTKLSTEQFTIQNRPWIGNIAEKKVYLDGNQFNITLGNFGKTAAHDVKVTSFVKKGKITEDEIIKNGESADKMDIAPNETWTYFHNIQNEELVSLAHKTDDVYFGLIINYKFEQTKEGKSILIIHWIPSSDIYFYKIKNLE